ncbi:MAG: hypothetical protein IIT56_09820 [Bacteroidales bacterium]|nr:hypothetical protein [Bacteroidales bacterium]
MKKLTLFFILLFTFCSAMAQNSKTFPLYVDNQGVLRRTSTGNEVSYCGTNYTLPFAHSFRAADYLGVDRFKAIDNDVYHFARLGFNAFRLHLWDVEISDHDGNLIENEHLKVLDYLVKKLEERHIDIVFTLQTNFGNGYPEKNEKTDGFTYLYDQCMIHSDPQAVKAQENYVMQLARHVNSFTGKSYLSDSCIVAFEINNEPCHSVSVEDTKNYINRMIKALKSTGYNKPIFYNVSHNKDFVSAYFQTEIDGGTYQWYPTGLVSGGELSFNYLPYIDEYRIDFQDVDGFKNKAKIIYEFDPGDILDTYLYPAVIRSFRSAGFQWITHFAYDATFLACYNTDYQTHYMNLLYSPGKAIGLKIGCEVAKTVPMYAKIQPYPDDTVFYNTTVSYKRNLAVFNSGEKFFYTNTNEIAPKDEKKLKEICGLGTSKLVKYDGTGAYFLDKLDKGVWRLEVLPDQVIVNDPFEKTSLKKKVGVLVSDFRKMEIFLQDLGGDFSVEKITENADFKQNKNELSVLPGVYILKNQKSKAKIDKNFCYNNIKVSEFFAPETNVDKIYLVHTPEPCHEKGGPLVLKAKIVSPQVIDSVVVYPSDISFWRDNNKSIKMQKTSYYDYAVTIPENWYYKGVFGYYILVYSGGKCTTYPSENQGNPLDWDADERKVFLTHIVDKTDNIVLISSAADDEKVFTNFFPGWGNSHTTKSFNMPYSQNALHVSSEPKEEIMSVIFKDIRGIIKTRENGIKNVKKLKLMFQPLQEPQTFNIGFTDSDGFTFTKEVKIEKNQEILEIFLEDLQQSPTYFLHGNYPSFSKNAFSTQKKAEFSLGNSEIFEIITPKSKDKLSFGFIGAWLE